METDAETQVTISKPGRILHFSDGVDEEIEFEEASEVRSQPEEDQVDPKSLTWGPWLTHYAWTSSSKVLNAVDYAGESLANFFGITTPKYSIEIEEYKRLQDEKKKIEEESVGWIPNNAGGDVPLVLSEPLRQVDTTDKV